MGCDCMLDGYLSERGERFLSLLEVSGNVSKHGSKTFIVTVNGFKLDSMPVRDETGVVGFDLFLNDSPVFGGSKPNPYCFLTGDQVMRVVKWFVENGEDKEWVKMMVLNDSLKQFLLENVLDEGKE